MSRASDSSHSAIGCGSVFAWRAAIYFSQTGFRNIAQHCTILFLKSAYSVSRGMGNAYGNACSHFAGFQPGRRIQRSGVRGFLGHVVRSVPCIRPNVREGKRGESGRLFREGGYRSESRSAAAAKVQAVPTLMVVKKQQIIFQQAGALRASDLTIRSARPRRWIWMRPLPMGTPLPAETPK